MASTRIGGMVQFAPGASTPGRHMGIELNLRAVSSLMNSGPVLHPVRTGVSKAPTTMANSPEDNTSMRGVTTDSGKGYLVPGTAEEQANFIRAVTVGFNDLETGRELSSVDAAIRLGLV